MKRLLVFATALLVMAAMPSMADSPMIGVSVLAVGLEQHVTIWGTVATGLVLQLQLPDGSRHLFRVAGELLPP